jgi:anaerobic magnesium-protoporphyrin IX monomethyl ester cyclase
LNRTKAERSYHWFPFSVLPLAQSLSDNGYEPVIIDGRVMNSPADELKKHINDALFAGISAMSGYQVSDGLAMAGVVRDANPDIPIVWGGWHATILPEESASHPLVDIAVVGRGEGSVVEIADAISSGKDLSGIAGLAFEKDGSIRFTGYRKPSELRDDARRYEDYISIESYINPATMALGYFTGHGCVFKCGFCSRHFVTNRYSPYPVEKVIDDLKYFTDKYGFKRVHFHDDNLFLNRERVLEIANGMVSSGIDLSWWANVRADVLPRFSRDELKLLVRSGMHTLFIGTESASQELLDIMTKGIRHDDIFETNEVMKEYDVILQLSYMFGVPGDDIDKMRMTVEQVKKLKQDNQNIKVQTCFYQPYPGTSLYEKALEWGCPRLEGMEEWGRLEPQGVLGKIPWLSEKEMALYEKEFNSFFN